MTDLPRPTIHELDELGIAMTLVAPPEFEDMNGHVNVRHHYDLHMNGTSRALQQIAGLDEEWIRRTGESTFSVEHHIKFQSEILIGHDLSTHLRLLARSDKAIHAMSILADRTTGQVASTLEFVELYVDLTTRRTKAMPDDLAKVVDAAIEQHAGLGWDLPRSHALGTTKAR